MSDPGSPTCTFVTHRRRLDLHRRWSPVLGEAAVVAEIEALDRAVEEVDGRRFVPTPFSARPELTLADGDDGSADTAGIEIWVKDETGNVADSHKGRHLFGVAVDHRLAARDGRPVEGRYAIASCGNAAVAAAVVAAAAGRELEVFVPTWADVDAVARIEALGARVVACPRVPGTVGDPAYLAFREAVERGAVPFSCQGTDTPGALDGGRTLAWEMGEVVDRLDRVVVQVGGGALATCVARGLAEEVAEGRLASLPCFHAVQPVGNHPLARAWDRLVAELLETTAPTDNADRAAAAGRLGRMGEAERRVVTARLRSTPDRYMWPWEDEPRSVATGILDDVTYDWIDIVDAMLASGGFPLVAGEEDLITAHRLGRAATGIDVSATGTAGLAGARLLAGLGVPDAGERVAVLFTGRR
ncbi:MAG: pyridoxal-phosphate dependent enzyme [Actinomyces sp.]|nr:MAG: pyridoxal-phosphate dependent enzyme [Actinomyces sp.]